MITYQSRFLTRGEVWFGNTPGPERVDWMVYHQRQAPMPNGRWRPFYTRVIDLTKLPEVLLAEMDGFTAADVRRAQKKDHTSCQRLEAGERLALSEFIDFYDRFAALKDLGFADRNWLCRTAEAGRLELWAADATDGRRLGYHVLYRDAKRVRSMHSVSFHQEAASKDARRIIGRANRLLVWTCMMHYREAGVEVFDLGGWYNGSTDSALLGINRFKAGFGGSVWCEYQGEVLISPKAWIVMNLARLLPRRNPRKPAASPPARPEVQLEPA
jgi:hypothetical protein